MIQFSRECCRTDDQADIIIYGVESEQVEEENDALNDMRYELGEWAVFRWSAVTSRMMLSGIHKDAEDDLEELMPSCCVLNVLDCLFMNLSSYCKTKTKPQDV